MGGGVDLRVGLAHLAVGADQVADPACRGRLGVVGRAIGEAELPVGVAQEREGEAELLGEGRVGLLVVEAGPEDLDALGVVLRDSVAEPATLGRSAGSVRLGIEPEDDVLPAVVRQPAHLAGVVLHLEIGGGAAGLEHSGDLLDAVRTIV